MPKQKRIALKKTLLLTLLLPMLGGCHVTQYNGSARILKEYPTEARKAAQVAPNFTRATLKEINRLEAELAKK